MLILPSRIRPAYWKVAALGLFVFHWAAVALLAVDVPFWDEWEYFRPATQSVVFTPSWLLAFHSEHRIVFTKLVAWVNYRLFRWDFAYEQTFNFAIFGVLLLLVYRLLRKASGDGNLVLAFLVFALSDGGYAIHSWAFGSQIHFFLLFAVASLSLLSGPVTGPRVLAALILIAASIYSSAGGVACALALSSTVLVREVVSSIRRRRSPSLPVVWALLFFAGTLALIRLWAVGYPSAGTMPSAQPGYPWELGFWSYSGALLSWIFGVHSILAPLSIAALAITALTVLLMVRQVTRMPENAGTWILMSYTLMLLSCVAAITIGRAHFGTHGPKQSRYYEIVILLLPALASGLHYLQSPLIRKRVLVGLWTLCFLGTSGRWNFPGRYAEIARGRTTGRECAMTSREGVCHDIYPCPIPERIEVVRRLGVSFARPLN